MPKKSGLGRQDDFDFGKAKPSKIKSLQQLRESDRTSFYLPPKTDLAPHDPCGNIHINDNPDLMILGKGGRQVGDLVLYDPIQEKNYLSQFSRYEDSIRLLPSDIFEQDNKTYYRFCSSDSPNGFWQVEVGGGGTYISFTPPVLTIICPRPFSLADLVKLTTDGTSIKWTQQQGRTTIISPITGDGSLNPTIAIIGVRSPLDPPILLLAELEDNSSIFTYLAIRTTVTEVVDGQSGMESPLIIDGGPDLTIPCNSFAPILRSSGTAFVWSSGTIDITWSPPPSNQAWIDSYLFQQDIDGVYETITTVSKSDRRATVSLGGYYRIVAVFNILGRGYSFTESCHISFPNFPPYLVLACDEVNGQSGMDGNFTITQYPISVLNYFVQPRDITDGQSGMDGDFVATIYNLTGGIVG